MVAEGTTSAASRLMGGNIYVYAPVPGVNSRETYMWALGYFVRLVRTEHYKVLYFENQVPVVAGT